MFASSWLAERFVLDLNGIALGLMESVRLLKNKKTQVEGEEKVRRIKKQIEEFRHKPELLDSFNLLMKNRKKDFALHEFSDLLQQLDKKKFTDIQPKIEHLISITKEFINEAGREKGYFKRVI